jgi:beta-galactosidase
MQKEFPFGVTFYPDQWPQEIWDESFRKIKETGFNVVRFGEMAWDWVQPQEDKFSWDELDKALELANKYGVKVVFGLATSQSPTWLLRKYPEVRPISNNGILYPEYGPRPNVCRDSETYKNIVEKYITAVVSRYKDNPAIMAWQVDNEPTYPPLDSTTNDDFCHCPNTQKKFLEWVKNKYKTIEELNKKWGTRFWTNTFGTWDDVTTPKCGVWDAGNPHIFMDWYRFKSDSIHNWLLWEKTIVDKIDGSRKVGTNGFLEICPRMLDHDVLAGGLDWYGWDVYPKGRKSTAGELAHTSDWWRSFGNGRKTEFHVTELQAGPNVRWGYPGYVTGREIKLWTYQMIAHGAKTILYHNWRTPIFGGEAGGFGMVNPDGTPTERLDAIKEISSEIKEIAEKLEGYEVAPEYAIAYLRDGDVLTFQEQGPPRVIGGQWESLREDIGLRHSMHSIEGAHTILWNKYNPIDFIFQRDLDAEKDLSQYKAILLPNPYLFTEKRWKTLEKYVKNGGILITESRFGAKTDMGFLQQVPLMEKCLGLKRRHHELIDKGCEPKIPAIKAYAHGYKDVIITKEKVLAKFSDGTPALIELKLGKGKIIYGCFSMFLSCKKKGNEGLVNLLRKSLPKPELNPGKNIEIVTWKGKKGKLYYKLDYTKGTVKISSSAK